MLNIEKQALAEKDLIDIWLYSFENWGVAQADKYHDHLTEAFSAIALNPSIGTNCDDVREGYRKYRSNRHFIFYKISNDTIHIIRVLGEEMNYDKHLG